MLVELPILKDFSDADYKVAEQLIRSLYFRLTNNLGPTSLPYYMDKFSSHLEANKLIYALAKDNVIKTSVRYNYAEIELNRDYLLQDMSESELFEIIRENKLTNYAPITSDRVTSVIAGATRVKLSSGLTRSGLVRLGFAKAGTHPFKYDIPMLQKYYNEVVAYSVKAMVAMEAKLGRSLRHREFIDYESTIRATIDYIISSDNEFVLGELTIDSRGRAIYACLSTIFNPIANKCARALVKHAPTPIPDASYLDNAYLAIAELISGFNSDIDAKLVQGKEYFASRKLHADLSNDDIYENIWLERLYNDIEAYLVNTSHAFTTPIELDFSSSNMVIIGLLLGHSDYIDHTKYMWEIEGLSKLHVKKAQTPYVFGSRAPIPRLWKKAKLEFTLDQVQLMKYHQAHGKYVVANTLKDILVMHSHPTATMQLHVGNERFTVECNRHKYVGDTTKQYVVYDTSSGQFKIISHTSVVKVPDLPRFKTYFPTGLIHNCDSQVMDNICKGMEWIIPVHDAGLVTLAEAPKFRNLAVNEMHKLRDNGESIVQNYFKSVNLDEDGWKKYARLQADIRRLNEGKVINITQYLLK